MLRPEDVKSLKLASGRGVVERRNEKVESRQVQESVYSPPKNDNARQPRKNPRTGKRRNRMSLSEITRRNVELIAELEANADRSRTLAEHLADMVTRIVGSWTFLIIQTVLLGAWMVVNLIGWWQHWDPYPFILLNLVLSFQAAFASPVILMSQNRQTKLSERRNELDLQINLLAEQESTEQLRLLRMICEHLKLNIADEDEEALEEPAHPDQIVEQIIKCTTGDIQKTKQRGSS